MCDFQTRALLVARSIRAARRAMAGLPPEPPPEVSSDVLPAGAPVGGMPLHGAGCFCFMPRGRGRGSRPVFAATATEAD